MAQTGDLFVKNLVDKTVYISGKGGEAESESSIVAIKTQLTKLLTNDVCRQTFISEGFLDPRIFIERSVGNKKGVSNARQTWIYTITSAFALRDKNIADMLGIDEDIRQNLIVRRAPATTLINDGGGGGITFIRPSAFTDNKYSLAEVVTHKLLHGMGIPGMYYSSMIGPDSGLSPSATGIINTIGPFIEGIVGYHDLSYLGKKYKRIIAACVQ